MPLGQAATRRCFRSAARWVEAVVETEFVDHVTAFVGAAGDADDAAALELGDLSDDRADGAAGGADHDRFAGLGLADVEQPHIRGKSGHSQHAERERRFRHGRIKLDEALAVGDRVALPAGLAEHQVAGFEIGVLRGFDARDGATDHHLADRDRRGVGRRVAHATAHIRVEREVERAQQQLPGGRRRKHALFKAEIVRRRRTVRARGEDDAAVDGVGHGFPLSVVK